MSIRYYDHALGMTRLKRRYVWAIWAYLAGLATAITAVVMVLH